MYTTNKSKMFYFAYNSEIHVSAIQTCICSVFKTHYLQLVDGKFCPINLN